ncbi:MAG: dihydrolipoyl dehydrogenase [Dehalococcoidia bacterium]|nr:MAG: dihydrolipoyl dehydrogenase [Dehalococcoidia bacterium]
MKDYDVVVVGSGCGMNIVEEAIEHGLRVALIDRGPLGGTCPNLGCIPSKLLIFPADRIVEVQESGKLGIEADVKKVDFAAIMERMRQYLRRNLEHMRQGIANIETLGYYQGTGRFSDQHTLEVNGEQLKGKKIFLASGSRPLIPPIKGLESAGYLTNETLLELKEKPKSLIIIGGGYVAVEYGHFFAAMGTAVTILEMTDRLVLAEEPEIAALLKKELGRRMAVHTGVLVEEVKRGEAGVSVVANDLKANVKREFSAEQVLVAVGRRSNADTLNVGAAGIELDKRGFIRVDDYLETTAKNIFAVGDANGREMFTHTANREAMLVADNTIHNQHNKMDYHAAPHAVFSHPQIASVGLTEAAARQNFKVMVGRANYSDVAKGEAMMEQSGFAKAVIAADTGKIVGFHIIGPEAPTLIQEIINAMAAGGDADHIGAGVHIHPAMPELIVAALNNLSDSGGL